MTVRRITRCKECGNRIDPDFCHCGKAVSEHDPMWDGHAPVPAGCTCGYDSLPAAKRKTGGYSTQVQERLDPERPKYSEAVKSIAAFCDKNAMTKACFQVLVSHLDNACVETRVQTREEHFRGPGRLKRLVRLK